MSLFTFILEYAGGTYVSQYSARNPTQAVKRWAEGERDVLTKAIGAGVSNLLDTISRERPVPVDNVRHVWCSTAAVARNLAVLNIVATAAP